MDNESVRMGTEDHTSANNAFHISRWGTFNHCYPSQTLRLRCILMLAKTFWSSKLRGGAKLSAAIFVRQGTSIRTHSPMLTQPYSRAPAYSSCGGNMSHVGFYYRQMLQWVPGFVTNATMNTGSIIPPWLHDVRALIRYVSNVLAPQNLTKLFPHLDPTGVSLVWWPWTGNISSTPASCMTLKWTHTRAYRCQSKHKRTFTFNPSFFFHPLRQPICAGASGWFRMGARLERWLRGAVHSRVRDQHGEWVASSSNSEWFSQWMIIWADVTCDRCEFWLAKRKTVTTSHHPLGEFNCWFAQGMAKPESGHQHSRLRVRWFFAQHHAKR